MVVRPRFDQGGMFPTFRRGRRALGAPFASVFALAVGVAVSACSSSDAGPSDADSGAELSAEVTCSADPRATAYVPGLERPARGGAFVATLVSATPAPPSKGLNTWVVKLTRGGVPLEGATLEVVPFMPDHGHGAVRAPTVTAGTGGEYTVADVALAMTGVWEVTVKVTAPVADEATFSFCIPG